MALNVAVEIHGSTRLMLLYVAVRVDVRRGIGSWSLRSRWSEGIRIIPIRTVEHLNFHVAIDWDICTD